MKSTKTIALFGGSFNPPGLHHRRIATELAKLFDKVIVVPCGPRPDKESTNSISAVHRAAMVDMNFRGLDRVEVDLFDLENEQFTRTHALEKHYGDRGEIWHVVGTDLIAGGQEGNSAIQREWENGKELWQRSCFLVIKRPGHPMRTEDLPVRSRLLEFDDPGSSEAIRKAVTDKTDFEHFVSPEVARYLVRHRLYESPHPREMRYVIECGDYHLEYDPTNPLACKVAAELPRCDASKHPSLVVVIGGDGSMLRAIRKLWRLRVPFYGINVGNLGFLLNSLESRPTIGSELVLQQLPLLRITVSSPDGKTSEELAFNDAWLERSTGQLAWLEVRINGERKLDKLVADGALISTAAGSASYALAMGASPLPYNTEALIVVGSNVFRPLGWKSAVLPISSSIELRSLEHERRPMVAYIDGVGLGSATSLSARVSRAAAVELVFEAGHDIAQKLARVQFPTFTP